MPRTTSFILGDHFERMIANEIASGRYGSASEVIREGLRLVEERRRRIEALDNAIEDGLASGVAPDFSWQRVRARGRDQADGQGGDN